MRYLQVFIYWLQKIVILKSNYCQGKFHLFFAIEHAQKLKSLVEVAENPCWEWNFRAECLAENLYTSMTTEVELCKQMIGDGIAHGIIVKVGVILIEKSIILLYAKDAALGSMIERRAPTLKSSWMFTNFMAQ